MSNFFSTGIARVFRWITLTKTSCPVTKGTPGPCYPCLTSKYSLDYSGRVPIWADW